MPCHKVIVDGVEYIPVSEIGMGMGIQEAVARALMALYWGEIAPSTAWREDFTDKSEGLVVQVREYSVRDSGMPLSEFLAEVVKRSVKPS
jgi:hypothetical protein